MNVESLGRSSLTTWGMNNGGQSISEILSEMVNKKDTDQSGGLTIDEMGIEEELFSQIDTDGDGAVTAEELKADLERRMAQSGLTNGQMGEAEFSLRVSRLISEKDADADGSLTLEEMGVDEEMFNRIDADGDGAVTAEELQADLEKMMAAGPPPPQQDMSEMVASILDENDGDEDGGLSLEELGSDQETFDRLDTNQDGVVSPEELQAGLEKIMARGQGQDEQSSASRSSYGYNAYANGAAASFFGGQANESQNSMFDAGRYSQEYNAGMYKRMDMMV